MLDTTDLGADDNCVKYAGRDSYYIITDKQEVNSINAIFDQTCYAAGNVVPDTGAKVGLTIPVLFSLIAFFMMLVLLENNKALNKNDIDYITE